MLQMILYNCKMTEKMLRRAGTQGGPAPPFLTGVIGSRGPRELPGNGGSLEIIV